MWWLVPLTLWLAWTGRGSSVDLSEAQSRGLQVALDEFHKHPPVQWAFQVTSVDIASDVVSGTGPGAGLRWGGGVSGAQHVSRSTGGQ